MCMIYKLICYQIILLLVLTAVIPMVTTKKIFNLCEKSLKKVLYNQFNKKGVTTEEIRNNQKI